MATNLSKKPREGECEDSQLLHSLEKLQHFQDDLEKVDDEASDKVLEVEQKYSEIRRPFYAKRNEIIKSIPDFWLTAFLHHPALCQLFNDEDEKVFKYLDSLEVEDFKDVKSGYSITFNFKPNPFFEDAKLTKNFTILDEGTTKKTNTIIKWKEGMGPANGGEPEKKGNKRLPSEDSIFSWFNETQQKEVAYGFQDEVADIIKEDLWPNPLRYFNNVPDLDLEDNEEGGDDEEDEEKEEEEVEEDDSEEDTEEDDN